MNETSTAPAAATGELLIQLADKLTGYRPTDPMHEATRLALAVVFAQRRYGYTTAAEVAERDVLRHAPRVRPEITRGEYALLLRKAAAAGGQL
ncbi:hypothetical protein ABZX62_00180 [Streptomyces flavidovirens]|uniref:hypothetical protein n=1 Tax=Streptomyces flavidovirens TaxID=67298 RepID=UPI0033BDD983